MNNNNLKIVSLNVTGISGYKKRKAIFRRFHVYKKAIIALQESHEKDTILWKAQWRGLMKLCHGETNSSLVNNQRC